MSKTITLRPRLSEKTYAQSEARVYVVEIDKAVNKHGVAKAIEDQFEVKVAKVNIVNVKGKAKRTISISGKRMKNADGKRPDFRKAYVTLQEGHSLPFFAAVEQEEQKEQATQAKIEKALEKQAAKAEKKPRRGLRRKSQKEEAE